MVKILGVEADPLQVVLSVVTSDYFSVFGSPPALGRTFLPEEDVPGKDRVLVLSHPF